MKHYSTFAKNRRKTIGQILMLLICFQTVISQKTFEFAEIETIWISDTTKTTGIGNSVTEIITKSEFSRCKSNQKVSLLPKPNMKIDSTGLFIVQTKNSIYQLYQPPDYSSSYS